MWQLRVKIILISEVFAEKNLIYFLRHVMWSYMLIALPNPRILQLISVVCVDWLVGTVKWEVSFLLTIGYFTMLDWKKTKHQRLSANTADFWFSDCGTSETDTNRDTGTCTVWPLRALPDSFSSVFLLLINKSSTNMIMGCFGSKEDEETKLRRETNKRIEMQLKKDKTNYKATHRLLLLG